MAKKTFYIVSDNIQTKSKDKARMKAIAKAFRDLGHKTVIGDVGASAHTKPKAKGCTKKNDVWVTIFGGVCGGTIADMTGYTGFGNWFKNDQLKKASLFVIWVSKPEGASINVATAKKLPKAHDDGFSPSGFNGIPNPKEYLKKKGVTWIEAGTTDAIVNLIKTQNWEGSGFDIDTGSSTKEITNKYTITHGFDSSTVFEGYLEVKYTVNNPKGKLKNIYIDWSSQAPSSVAKFNNDNTIQWVNDKKFIYETNLLEKIKTAEKDYAEISNNKYYLKQVILHRDFADKYDDKETEENESLLFDDKDQSSYKMLIYDLGVFNGENVKIESMGVCGKTLLDGMKNTLEKSQYLFNIHYSRLRNNDRITFKNDTKETNISYTFNEGFEGNIIGISNVKYSPTSQLMNSSAIIFKSQKKEDSAKATYNYVKKAKVNEVLRYGEQMKVENLTNETGSREATQKSYDNLEEYFKPITTFTVKSVGLPPVEINDWVETKTVNPLLTNEYRVASRKINIDVEDRPMVQTEFGLGDIDAPIKVKKNLAKQRKKLVRQALDLNESVQYEDRQTDEFIDGVWVD